ncbi:MAG: alpha/beta fold hydrolase [Acidimicrobiia bacterium]
MPGENMKSDKVTLPSGVEVAWRETGNGEALILLHGLDGWNWEKWFESKLAEKYRIIAPFLRGFEESRGPMDYTMIDLGDDIAGLIRELDIVPANVGGHSIGGMVAQEIAINYPELVKKLVLISTKSHTGERAREFAMGMALIAEKGSTAVLNDPSLRTELQEILDRTFPDGPPPLDGLGRGLEEPHPEVAAAWKVAAEFTSRDRLENIKSPTLIVHGTRDMIMPYKLGQWTHEALPGSVLADFVNFGHTLYRRDECALRVLDFLESS